VSFCSRTTLADGGAWPGTGVRGVAYVFVPVPKRWWGEEEMNSGWASAEELETIAAARQAGVVTRLYNPPPPASPGAAKVLVYRSPGEASEALGALLERLAGRFAVDEAQAPRLMLCTQGTRDRCCAKWGYAVYRRASALFLSGASPYEPLETSHLGGDRFAATGIVFPSGSMYGHLDQVELAALLTAEAEGRLSPQHYRGRVFDSQLAQVVRAGLAREGLFDSAAERLDVSAAEDGESECTARLADGRRYAVALTTTESAFFGSCRKLARGRASRSRRLTYVSARLA
jgi:hypothetical protein